jgi:hypothetical protein
VSPLLGSAVACFLVLLVLAAVGVLLVVWSERRHGPSGALRTPPSTVHATADVSLYLRFEGQGARTIAELVEAHGPHGVLPKEALPEVAEAILVALDDATHGALVVAGFRVAPVYTTDPSAWVVCLRVRSRAPFSVPARPTHRHDLGILLRSIAALDAEQVISADFLRARPTSDRAAVTLEVLLGPHLPPPNP